MSRRQVLTDVHQARDIRRLQEQAALQSLRKQQQALAEADQRLQVLEGAHRAAEAAWTAALTPPFFDADMISLWRAQTGRTKADVLSGEQTLAEETQALDARREAWALRLRLSDAIDTVMQSVARKVRQADEERQLQAAEDALRHRRRT